MAMIGNFEHFVTLAESLQWDETEIDFSADRAAWPSLTTAEHERILGLVAGFCVAETAVATQLVPYREAAPEPSMEAAFRAQARDEARHARFFERVAADVAEVPGDTTAERLDVLRERVRPELVELFEEQLPDTARRLAEDSSGLTAAVGLYHMIIEGVVLLAGQHAMLDALESASVALPGLRKGMELVLRDERWHIGFGSRIVQTSEVGQETAAELVEQGESAAKIWGDLITAEAIETAVRQHRRRLKASGIKFW
ncbi:ribonucleotide-diphosphate reductase subunit beta [Pseudonocardia phyllosphaerae]|uniref:ribonucleotide-diphosphate reductase subunit beta n=1 Tax=Pseudonocardia phyllosphaerae TaxID=3390502 RepID=UPI00397DA31B